MPVLSIAILALAAAMPVWTQSPTAMPVADESLPPGPAQAKATKTCLECHGARIILQQRLSKAVWTRELDKMRRWGALVDPQDRDSLIEYLSTNFGPDQPPYDPQRTMIHKPSMRGKVN
ncbi:MAG: hypothetical protein ABSD20_07310 [Terriglobales bacterium]